jgi:two-component system, cell cycle response regulator DivK
LSHLRSAEPHAPRKSTIPRVLVVDDFPDGREMLAEYLAFRGFDVTEASTGADAVETARHARPDVILMDLQMRGIDGWEATRRVKTDPATQNIVVVAVTAHALPPEADRARDAGCDALIAKPFDLAALADALLQLAKKGPTVFNVPGLNLTVLSRRPEQETSL